jgi:hypothetical protein
VRWSYVGGQLTVSIIAVQDPASRVGFIAPAAQNRLAAVPARAA